MLDRVRKYAGKDHPLTIALEKEVSLPRQKPLRGLWRTLGVIALLLCIWLIGGNLYADYKEPPLNQAIASYVRQHPKTAPNQSAIDLQGSIAKLGIYYERFGDSPFAAMPSYIHPILLQNILIANILDRQQLPTPEVTQGLVAIEKLARSFQKTKPAVSILLDEAKYLSDRGKDRNRTAG